MEFMCNSFVIWVSDYELLASLIFLPMTVSDIILGMDWLDKYHASVDCYTKVVNF